MKAYIRQRYFRPLWERLHKAPRLLQVVVGPRQVGKTTLALQVLSRWRGPKRYETADQPSLPTAAWIGTQWEAARQLALRHRRETLLVLDEVQKIPRWSEMTKRLTDEDRRRNLKLRVVLLGSSALLMQRGLSESLAGRFELHRHPQWSFGECRAYFGLRLEDYVYFGGYPGALALRKDEDRWQHFIRDSLIETVLSKDVLLLAPVSKPALLRQAFGLAVSHPAEIVSYQKMLGTLQDAGNTTTIASYLRLLARAFLVVPLERFSGSRVKQRGSTPKLLMLDNALVTSMSGVRFAKAKRDAAFRGRLIENAVGARLYWQMQERGGELWYWRDRHDEVDFIASHGRQIQAVEVKTGRPPHVVAGLQTFLHRHPGSRGLLLTNASSQRAEIRVRPVTLQRFFENDQLD